MMPSAEVVTIPDAKYIPKPDEKPSYLGKRVNFADYDNEMLKVTIQKAQDWMKKYRDTFKNQNARKNFEREMDTADEMTRAAATAGSLQGDTPSVSDSTDTQTTTSTYYRSIKTISAGETAVILGTEKDLPMKYEPIPGCKDYRVDEAKQISDYQNALLSHYMEIDDTRSKIGDANYFGNKYGNIVLEVFWDYRIEERVERVPVYSKLAQLAEKMGFGKANIKSWKFEKKDRVIADNPAFRWYDWRNFWTDCTIPSDNDFEDQSCLIARRQMQINEIFRLQKCGEYRNADKITRAHVFNAEQAETDQVMNDRKTNAGEGAEIYDSNTLLDVYSAWIKLPVDIETGEWDDKKNMATWFLTTWVGDIDSINLCLQIEPNPHFSKKLPLRPYRALRDDKGLFHLCYSNLIKCYAAMEMTSLNFLFDNVKSRNKKPWIMERGSIAIRDKTFVPGGNRIWYKTPGAENPHEIEIGDTTQASLLALEKVNDYFKETMGTNRAFLGEPLGGRATASEVNSVFEQALKPALEEAKYKANQMLIFIAEWFMEMSRQYSDPETLITIMKEDKPITIKPTELWGPLNIRVTSIKSFQDGILRRREEDQFINQIFPLVRPLMSQQGQINFFSQVAKNRGFDDVEHWWVKEQDFDARRVAKSENEAILFQGQNLMPSPDENHDIHIQEHKLILASYLTLPPDQQVPENAQRLKLMIRMHEQFKAQSAAGQQSTPMAQQQAGPEQGPPNLPGEATGAPMASEGGQEGNLEAPVA